MNCKLNSPSPPVSHNLTSNKPNKFSTSILKCRAQSKQDSLTTSTQAQKTQATGPYNIKFQTLQACKLGIARYPDFEYNADGGIGTATGEYASPTNEELSVSFDVQSLYIPALTGATTRFLGLPLPPFLKIEIVAEMFQGIIDSKSGKVELEFRAKFLFSIGTLYRAAPLVVETMLTSEESIGAMRKGKGERMDGQGNCRLVSVATIDPVNDLLLDSFLGLPTECIADLSARISINNLD